MFTLDCTCETCAAEAVAEHKRLHAEAEYVDNHPLNVAALAVYMKAIKAKERLSKKLYGLMPRVEASRTLVTSPESAAVIKASASLSEVRSLLRDTFNENYTRK